MTSHMNRSISFLSTCYILITIVASASAQNAFAPSEAGKGRKCYFGECSDGTYEAPNRPTETPAPQTSMPIPSGTPPLLQGSQLPAKNYAEELTNFGVQPQSFLQSDVSTNTPLSIPGGRVVNTAQLYQAITSGKRDFLLVDALAADHAQTISGAYRIRIATAGYSGTFNDTIQQQLFTTLHRLTGGNVAHPLVFFCAGAICWESYNAALRAMQMGFSNVYWYRGGIAAWQAANLPMQTPH